jgi:hypothetical protein
MLAIRRAPAPQLIRVFARHLLSKLTVIALHVAAWFVAFLGVVLCAAMWPSLGPGVDINVTDTSFVVLHGHFTLLPGMLVVAITLVAWRSRTLNFPIRLSWALLALHILAATLLLRTLRSVPPTPAGETVSIVAPNDPTLGYLYLGSALATVGLCLAGWWLSLVRAVRMSRRQAA